MDTLLWHSHLALMLPAHRTAQRAENTAAPQNKAPSTVSLQASPRLAAPRSTSPSGGSLSRGDESCRTVPTELQQGTSSAQGQGTAPFSRGTARTRPCPQEQTLAGDVGERLVLLSAASPRERSPRTGGAGCRNRTHHIRQRLRAPQQPRVEPPASPHGSAFQIPFSSAQLRSWAAGQGLHSPTPLPRLPMYSRNVSNCFSSHICYFRGFKPHVTIRGLLPQSAIGLQHGPGWALQDSVPPQEPQRVKGTRQVQPAAPAGILNTVHEVCLTSMMCAAESQRNRHLK